jgi:glucose 1-dehydrogenase
MPGYRGGVTLPRSGEGNNMELAGKKALVTGAARGIGRGCALELARVGADVVVNDLTTSPEAEAALVAGDVFERPPCEAVVTRAVEAFGRLDILVSNPASSRRGDFLDYDTAVFDKVLKGTSSAGST